MTKSTGAGVNLTRKQADRLKAPLELDLMAFYSVLSEDTMRTVSRMSGEGATADEIIAEVEGLFDE